MSPESNKDKSARCIISVDPEKVPKEGYPGANDFSYALIWIKTYGKGRVYYSELGHNQAIFSVPCVARAMLDGLQYAAGDLKVGPIAGAITQRTTTQGANQP
jgi:type 1 glutamine amidotransferase